MNVPPARRRRETEARRWLQQAREDLEVADRERDHVYRIACFHAQQAAEKAIKAILMYDGIRFDFGRQGHDLDALRLKVPIGWRLHSYAVSLADLTIWGTERRYPGDLPDATHGDVQKALGIARQVYDLAEGDLSVKGVRVP